MAQVIVRNLDDAVLAAVKRRAKARGKSVEQFLREGIAALAAGDRTGWLDELERIRALAPAGAADRLVPLAEEMLREDRDGR